LPTTLHVTSHTGTKRAGGKENNGQHETCSACHPLLSLCRMAAQAPYQSTNYFGGSQSVGLISAALSGIL
ncbi:hypothetical protein WI617_14155, partial [Salmonella enterica subsp. enterica serovar Corvallis]